MTTGSQGSATRWLAPLRTAVGELADLDIARLRHFEQTLSDILGVYPVDAGLDPDQRSQHLRRIRQVLAGTGDLALAVPVRHGGCGRPAVAQAVLQFICGYYDVDLRDSTGLGHGRLIAEHATPQVRDRWLPRLLTGAIPGIAITEPHGGSQVHATSTTATACSGGGWTVTGTKTWISRLTEAAIFCVFFTDPTGRLTAAAVDAASPGLDRTAVIPAGLSGWAWGELRLDAVHVRRCDLLGEPGEGMRLLKDHFACYRPLVAATALGAAAGVHDQVSARLEQRRHAGAIASLRDNALITLGRTYAGINAALLSVVTAQRLAEAGDPSAHLWGCAVKAHGVDVAYQAASELTLLAGAAGFAAGSRTAKACRDLNALLYADGIHDSLYRSAGRSLASTGQAVGVRVSRPPAAAHRVPAARRADQAAGTPSSSAATVPSATA
jgi:alkylation response protein AidB-like acyl-CoA dehydrogenase